ncbi:hypothetical protein PspLS_11810 [Pyricularia sp. CBS 133598]|nr:hypothetical protein PspLS_11810 [Pyricularia sp. CBS 133598]
MGMVAGPRPSAARLRRVAVRRQLSRGSPLSSEIEHSTPGSVEAMSLAVLLSTVTWTISWLARPLFRGFAPILNVLERQIASLRSHGGSTPYLRLRGPTIDTWSIANYH